MIFIKRPKNWKQRLQELSIKNYNYLTCDEKLELISCKYYEKEKLTYEEFAFLTMTNDEVSFFYKNMLYQIDYGLRDITAMYITEYKGSQKVSERSEQFSSIIELLDKFRIEGKRIRDIWNEVT